KLRVFKQDLILQ
ncbi:hypothetical protein NPIL_603001, partial [Nephila pilipes]